jgi:hypothetical protein
MNRISVVKFTTLLLVFGSMLLIWPSRTLAQASFPATNGKALAGITRFDANVVIMTWLNMTGDRDAFDSNVQSAFELGLRRDGVIVYAAAPNYLLCVLKFTYAAGVIAYSYDVDYYTPVPQGCIVTSGTPLEL